jgi:asparagine synthase (glutamine-hydrolysing)
LCGIAGFTHNDGRRDPERIRQATWSLAHRGPDQQGVFESPHVSLGAARLKIIDLASGDQPIFSDDGASVIVFNGEIYNHQELRRELQQLGHRFHSACDTETVLHAFMQWDTRCFARLRGMFAVALWNEPARRLVLARDRLGIKPLYLAHHGRELIFGSELKALLVHPQLERRLSLAGLDCYLALNYVPWPWTLLEGFTKLPPGHWLEWRNGNVRTEAYWSLPAPPAAAPRRDIESAKEELDSLLRQSVREHLLSDVPLGVWLSGGVDSSTIVHYAAAEYGSRLKTFSISFRGRSFDETPFTREVAARYGTEHVEFDLNPGVDLQGAIDEFAYYCDEPNADAGALPVWFLSKLCKTRTTVAFSGEGADEFFGGYLTYQANRLAAVMRMLPRPLLRLLAASARQLPVSDEKIGFEYMLKRFLEGCLLPVPEAHVYWNGIFSAAQKRLLAPGASSSALADILRELAEAAANGDGVAPFLWFDQKYYLPDDILAKVDRMSMAHAVEVRPPFLDHRIVEFAATLPPQWKLHGRKQKFILKELMKDKLPATVLRRKKVGFDIPAHEWLRGPLRPLLVETLQAGISDYGELFQKDVLEKYLRCHLERKINVGYHLWGLLILFRWMKRWRVALPKPAAGELGARAVTGTHTWPS